VKRTARVRWCPGWESNPHEEKSPEDFKSSASAIPPPGQQHYKLIESKPLVQHCRFESWVLKHHGVGSDVSWCLCGAIQPLPSSQRVLWRQVRISASYHWASARQTKLCIHALRLGQLILSTQNRNVRFLARKKCPLPRSSPRVFGRHMVFGFAFVWGFRCSFRKSWRP
jgi:hypothetical protein